MDGVSGFYFMCVIYVCVCEVWSVFGMWNICVCDVWHVSVCMVYGVSVVCDMCSIWCIVYDVFAVYDVCV